MSFRAQATGRPLVGQCGSESDRVTAPGKFTNRSGRRIAGIIPGLADFLSIETCFVLFLFTGRYKALPELQGFPIDFTLLFLIASFCVIAWAIVSGRMKPIAFSLPVLVMIIFTELAVASVFWSSLDPLNIDKALRYFFLTATSFFMALMLAQDHGRRIRLTRMLALVNAAILLHYAYYRYALGVVLAPREPTIGVDGLNYLQYGSCATTIFIISLALATFGSRKQLYGAVLGAGATLYALLLFGGRGPLLVALLATFLLVFGLLRRSAPHLRVLWRLATLLSMFTALGAVGYVALESSSILDQFRTLERYQADLSRDYIDDSMGSRLMSQDLAFRQWLVKPILGWGIGEFRIMDEAMVYPHNLLLEILMEMGIVGAFLFLTLCLIAIRDCMHIARDPACDWTDAAIALLFLTDLALRLTVQGYLADDRTFFAFMGLAIGSRIARGRCSATEAHYRNRPPPAKGGKSHGLPS